MINFGKKLAANSSAKILDPLEIYNSLDRASDKGPLRPAQESVLNNWYNNFKDKKDVIIKLHTGQGKTLVGLLTLLSKLNEGKGPALYLCPNIYLVEQTCEQAKQFGVSYCRVNSNNEIPHEFWDSRSILITHVQLLFNGFSKFGIKNKSNDVASIVLDDSHACIDTIQGVFTLKIDSNKPIYPKLLTLFERDLESQGVASLEEIKLGEYEALLPVPYWAWQDKHVEVVSLLAENKGEYRFEWELIKDIVKDCQCIFSGKGLEIAPYRNPIELFGSFYKANHRIFMSATTNNDSFFIKGLGLNVDVVKNPVKYNLEKWSGEKMILIPYLFNYTLDRADIINIFGKPNKSNKYGIVALTPSAKRSELWLTLGSEGADTKEISRQVKLLKEGNFEKTIVFTNRYDGIDLPDDMCRLLILDSKPYAISLLDRYQESCRVDSKVIDLKVAQKIEQGLGRGVRGEKDYCCIILTGNDLIKAFRERKFKQYFSSQTNQQIDIGFETIEFAMSETSGVNDYQVLDELISLIIKRDPNWKDFYRGKMDEIEEKPDIDTLPEILSLEANAEDKYLSGDFSGAAQTIQKLIDTHTSRAENQERGWYFQEMARYIYPESKVKSAELQLLAYKTNRFLLKPSQDVEFQKLKINKSRLENIKNWIGKFESYENLKMEVNEITTNLSFGIKADRFEKALHELGVSIGFACERPDKELKKGPDNLWNVRGSDYILFECKNEVIENRAEINKYETGQMNVSCAWFKDNYAGETVKNIMIIPTKNISSHGAFSEEVDILLKSGLNQLVKNIINFFKEFKDFDLSTITESQIETFLNTHNLSVEKILTEYTVKPYQKK